MPRIYQSIFFESDWAHQRFFGWTLESASADCKCLLSRRVGLQRRLFLLRKAGRGEFERALRVLARVRITNEIVVHDFDDVLEADLMLEGFRFRKVTVTEQLLNVATLVVDLRPRLEEIFANMSSDYRRKIKKAEASGAVFTVHTRPAEHLCDLFVKEHARLAAERNFQGASLSVITAMYQAGRAVLCEVSRGGSTTNLLHLYFAGDKAIFMYGVNLAKENDGLGQYLHWRAMAYMKSRGVAHYDLGGVVSSDPKDGIFAFKSKFGAEFVCLGKELIYRGFAVSAARKARSLIRLGER